MLIRVRYNDDTCGLVDDCLLESLIVAGKIVEFRRSSGWVRIGRDALRGQRIERRRKGALINIFV
jgi:hypothetical protein